MVLKVKNDDRMSVRGLPSYVAADEECIRIKHKDVGLCFSQGPMVSVVMTR